MVTNRANMLCILKILQDYSDEDHKLSAADIVRMIDEQYMREEGKKHIDRRTVYECIDSLRELGYEISDYKDDGGYYLMERTFSQAEIRLLMDAIYSCEYISKRQTEELLEKLRGFLSVHDRKKYSYTNIVTSEKKSPNHEVFLNIEILDQAISQKKMVSFTYMDYDYDKKLKPRRAEKYVVNPYSLVCDSEHYYLILIYKGQTKPSYYRVDMMKDISILDDDIEISKTKAGLDTAKKVIYAHMGEPEMISLKCDKSALRYVIERFGSDVHIMPSGDGSFTAVFQAAPEGLVYWALQYLQSVEVLAPESVRNKVKEIIQNNKYQDHQI